MHAHGLFISAASAMVRNSMEPFIVALLMMASVLHAMVGVSRLIVSYMLTTFQVVVLGGMFATQKSATLLQSTLMDAIPKDVWTALKFLGLVPDIVTYVCCPKCFVIYEADASRPDNPFPRLCNHKETRAATPCSAALVYEKVIAPVRPGMPAGSRWLPFRTYPCRRLEGWLVKFL